MCEWCFGFLFKPTLRKPVSNSNSFPNLFAQGGGVWGGGYTIHDRNDKHDDLPQKRGGFP